MKSNEVKTNSTREGKQGTDFDRAHPHRGGRRHTETYICSESSRVSFHSRTPILWVSVSLPIGQDWLLHCSSALGSGSRNAHHPSSGSRTATHEERQADRNNEHDSHNKENRQNFSCLVFRTTETAIFAAPKLNSSHSKATETNKDCPLHGGSCGNAYTVTIKTEDT